MKIFTAKIIEIGKSYGFLLPEELVKQENIQVGEIRQFYLIGRHKS